MTKKVKVKPLYDGLPEGLYRATLPVAGYTVAEDGAVSRPSSDGLVPLLVDEKPVYVPTKALRARNQWSDIQAYHPMCEDALCGQSTLIQRLVRNLCAQMSGLLISTLDTLIQVACDPALQKENNNPVADEMLTQFAVGVKKNTYDKWVSLTKKLAGDPMLSIYINRDMEDDEGVKQSRLAVLTFPLEEMAESKDAKIGGADMGSKANKAIVMETFKYIIDPIPRQIGNSGVVPYYQTYLMILREFVKRLNEVNEPFIRISEWEPIDESWFPAVDDLSPYMGRIPRLPNCSGEVLLKSKRRTTNVNAGALFDEVRVPSSLEEIPDSDDLAPPRRTVKRRSEREFEEREERRREDRGGRRSIHDFEEERSRGGRRSSRRRRYEDDDDYDDRSPRRRSLLDDLDGPRTRRRGDSSRDRRGSRRDREERRGSRRSRGGFSIHDI